MRSVHTVIWQAKWRVGRHFEAFEAASHLVLHPQGARRHPMDGRLKDSLLSEQNSLRRAAAAPYPSSPQLPTEETCI
jgi:hypothetical protein